MQLRALNAAVLLAVASFAYAQDTTRGPDVESVDAIINAYYDVISGRQAMSTMPRGTPACTHRSQSSRDCPRPAWTIAMIWPSNKGLSHRSMKKASLKSRSTVSSSSTATWRTYGAPTKCAPHLTVARRRWA